MIEGILMLGFSLIMISGAFVLLAIGAQVCLDFWQRYKRGY